jgi:hypothetical protein
MTAYREMARCVAKEANNARFVALVRSIARPARAMRAVVLDGPAMRTSRALSSAFGRRISLMVPQHHPPSIPRMKASAPRASRVTIVPGTTAEWLTKPARGGRFNAAYFDTTTAITGNRAAAQFPLEDMRAFLEHRADRCGPVALCATFVARTPHGLFGNRSSAADQIVGDYLRPLFAAARFAVADLRAHTYRRGPTSMAMVFVSVILRYDAAIPTSRISFIVAPDGQHYDGYAERVV